jgi:iron complex outermembrane receptor protein
MHRITLQRQPLAVAVGLMVTGGFSQHVVAQDVDDIALEEITVTAQKREESLLETPIAITTLDSVQLEENRVFNLTDVNGYIPNVDIPPFATSIATPTVFIRGMGNTDVQTTSDSTAGVYLDGVVLARTYGLALDIADLERIEVLRGPQGTLYGRNTTAGAINYVTRKPHDEFSIKARLSAGNYNYQSGQIDLNVPVTDRFYFKVAYLKDKIDGWVDNQNTTLPDQIDPYQRDNEAAAVALRWLATDNFTLDYAYDYSDLEYGNGYYQPVSVAPFNTGTAVASDDRQDEALFAKGLSPSTAKVQGHNLTLNWDVGAVTLRSITGYRKMTSDLNQNFLEGFVFAPETQLSSEFVQDNSAEQDQWSQEFQILGNAFGDSVQYVAGLYWFKEETDEAQQTNFADENFFFGDKWAVDAESESKAIYGQGTWRPNALSQKLGLTLGLRYTEDERKATKNFLQCDLPGCIPDGVTFPTAVSGDKDFSNTSGNAVVDYFFTDSINTYVKYSTGYRSGGFSTRSKIDNFQQGFDPEEVQAFELGFKSRLWEDRLSLNAAAFYNDYKDLQVAWFEPPVFNQVLNAGEATISGAEIEFVARLSRGWTIDGFYAYLHGEYGEFIDPEGNDVKDDVPFSNAPRHMTKFGAEYAFPMTSIGQVTAKVDYLWRDEFNSGNKDPINLNPAYGLWNARVQWLGIPLPAGSIRMGLWGKNLSNEDYRTITTDFSGGTGLAQAAQFGTPRTYGLDFIYEY